MSIYSDYPGQAPPLAAGQGEQRLCAGPRSDLVMRKLSIFLASNTKGWGIGVVVATTLDLY